MPRPLLPPRGIFIPTALLFECSLPPATVYTWAQLRALAWGRDETPPFSLDQISRLTGKKASTIYGHMAALRDRDALRWRPADRGTIVVSFPEPSFEPVDEKGVISMNLEKPSLKDSSENQLDSGLEDLRGDAFQKSGNPGRSSQDPTSPAQLYRSITRISPNPAQRAGIAAAVSDLGLWHATIEHWLAHGWNPRNLPGLLDLYSRGGPSGCRFCSNLPPSRSGALDQTLFALDEIRKEFFNG